MRTILAALAILCVATTAQAQTKWRLAGNFATEHSSSVAMNQFRDELAKASGGQLGVDVFPAMQLGGAAENVQNVRAGTLQMIWVGMAFLSRTVPECAFRVRALCVDRAFGAHHNRRVRQPGRTR